MFSVIAGILMASGYFGGYKDAGIFNFTTAVEPVEINSNVFLAWCLLPLSKHARSESYISIPKTLQIIFL